MPRITPLLLISFLIYLSTTDCSPAQAQPPTEAQIKKRVQNWVEKKKRAPGLVVGWIDKGDVKVVAEGVRKAGGTEPVDADSIFEIGSITKVFTALLLQQMVDSGEVTLDDPISKFLPPSVKTPTRNGKQITLLDLATHTSGLPRLPDNLSAWQIMMHADNPYAKYTVAELYQCLSDCKLTRDIGAEYEYSNLGMGLAGHLLALKAGTNYESSVIKRICAPLKMDSTRITLSPELKSRLATGHSSSGKPVSNWEIPALPGCGALRSSVNDLLKFLAANMGEPASPLSAAMAKTHVPRREAFAGQQIGLAWHINTASQVWHNGETGGYHSFIGFDKQAHRGVVVLANSENDIDQLGLYVLTPVRQRAPANVSPQVYDQYVGKYKLAPGAILTISRDGDRFFARLTGQQKIEFFPESESDFFCKVVDAQLTFVKKGEAVEAVVLHQNGLDQKAPRVN